MENACSGEKSNNLCYACTPDKNASQDQTVSKKNQDQQAQAHCVRKSFFFLTIISKHICTTPFDCFEREW
jgi:hypothetical protein